MIADLRQAAPDLILHGGDLADGGSSPLEIVDRVRDLGWPGVVGNTDEMLFNPESLTAFAKQSSQLKDLFTIIGEMAAVTREALGGARLAWLRQLPKQQVQPPVALVHASPGNLWRAPSADASDAELEAAYAQLGQPVAIYGHIHRGFVRHTPMLTVVNTGSVGLPYDGDARAAYLLITDSQPELRRVEYDVEKECRLLTESRIPHGDWVARMLRSGSFEMP